jgi:hypothetical protein
MRRNGEDCSRDRCYGCGVRSFASRLYAPSSGLKKDSRPCWSDPLVPAGRIGTACYIEGSHRLRLPPVTQPYGFTFYHHKDKELVER